MQQRLAVPEHLTAERQHLAPEHIVCDCQFAQPLRHRSCVVRVIADHLDRHKELARTWVRLADEQSDAVLAVGHQIDCALHAGQHSSVRTCCHVDAGDVARPWAVRVLPCVGGEQLGQPELTVLETDHPDEVVLHTGFCQPHVQRRLYVDVLIRRRRSGGDPRLGVPVVGRGDQPPRARAVLGRRGRREGPGRDRTPLRLGTRAARERHRDRE